MSGADPAEIAKFDAMATQWRDPDGPAAPLHAMNPARLDYIRDQLCARHGRDPRAARPLEGLSLVDIGCGGGLVTEPMARLGAAVTGVDASAQGVAVARAAAEAEGLDIAYRNALAETLADEGAAFDAVLALEIVEHVPDQAGFLATLSRLLRPGGTAILSTVNRTPQSWLAAILLAEHVLRWLPRGTHDWRRFPTPEELTRLGEAAGLALRDRCGLTLSPLSRQWRRAPDDLSVNYLIVFEKTLASAGGRL